MPAQVGHGCEPDLDVVDTPIVQCQFQVTHVGSPESSNPPCGIKQGFRDGFNTLSAPAFAGGHPATFLLSEPVAPCLHNGAGFSVWPSFRGHTASPTQLHQARLLGTSSGSDGIRAHSAVSPGPWQSPTQTLSHTSLPPDTEAFNQEHGKGAARRGGQIQSTAVQALV